VREYLRNVAQREGRGWAWGREREKRGDRREEGEGSAEGAECMLVEGGGSWEVRLYICIE